MKQLYVVGMMLAVFGAGLSAMEEEASGALAGEGDNPLNAVVKLEVTVKPDIRYSWITMRTVRRRGLPPEWAIRHTTTMRTVRLPDRLQPWADRETLENGTVFDISLETVRRLIELGRKDTRVALAEAGLARDGR